MNAGHKRNLYPTVFPCPHCNSLKSLPARSTEGECQRRKCAAVGCGRWYKVLPIMEEVHIPGERVSRFISWCR